MNYFVNILIGIVFVVCITIFVKVYSSESYTQLREIPKIIWTYWSGSSIPKSVDACIKSWKKHNPDHTVIILNEENLEQYIEEDVHSFKFATTNQRTSDFVRLCVLTEYGGTWIDASIFMSEPLDNNKTEFEFIGYYINASTTDMRYPVIENWFFRCLPGSEFITKWKDCFLEINNFPTITAYVKYIEDKTDLQNIQGKEYLTMHIAAQYLFQHYQIDMSKLSLLCAEDGPFKYLAENKWDSKRGIINLYKYKNEPITKFRGGERTQIESMGLNLEEVLKTD